MQRKPTAMYARRLQPVLEELLGEFRIVYLAGPRQAGKTTLARLVSRDLEMEYITLDDQSALASAQNDPHGFVRSLGRRSAVLDEFQYAPTLIAAIKETSDRTRGASSCSPVPPTYSVPRARRNRCPATWRGWNCCRWRLRNSAASR